MNDRQIDLSVVVITLNEEKHLRSCLQSVPTGSELIVLDSGSVDSTVKIAEECGAKVFSRTFTNYADQKNAAIAHATRGWVLMLDADEVADSELEGEIARICRSTSNVGAYRLRRRLRFMGRVLRFGKTTDWPVRLFKRGSGQFVGTVHEEFKVQSGSLSYLSKGAIIHTSYDDLSDYFAKFNNYTTRVAEQHRAKGEHIPWLKHYFRPGVEFVVRYFFRLGFMDGYPGYCYALISSLYAFVKYAKLAELQSDR